LLYEIVTLGALPYSSIDVKNLMKELKSGYRMERPYHCHRFLYELMMLCWQANPLERPSFSVLAGKLQNFLTMENSWGERIIDLQRMFDKCTSEM
jgi:Protein tyrosine and serine/threonine kinase